MYMFVQNVWMCMLMYVGTSVQVSQHRFEGRWTTFGLSVIILIPILWQGYFTTNLAGVGVSDILLSLSPISQRHPRIANACGYCIIAY